MRTGVFRWLDLGEGLLGGLARGGGLLRLMAQRQSLISALDAVRVGMAQDSAWGNLNDAQKLAQSFCSSRVVTLSVPETCTFYSTSAKAWSRFYDEAEEVLAGTA